MNCKKIKVLINKLYENTSDANKLIDRFMYETNYEKLNCYKRYVLLEELYENSSECRRLIRAFRRKLKSQYLEDVF